MYNHNAETRAQEAKILIEKIDGYDCHFLAYLIPKDEDGEIYPILTDDPDYPVCELVGGRLIPVDL